MNETLRREVIEFLTVKGILAGESGDCVAVNRDSMCNSDFHEGGFPEDTTYPAVLSAVEEHVGVENRLYWCGKTDDDLFMGSMVR